MNFLSRRVQYLFILTAGFFLLQCLFRIMFLLFVSELPITFDIDLLKALWIGFRFDLRVAVFIAITFLPFLIIPRYNATNYPLIRSLLTLWFALVLLSVLILYTVDTGHYFYLAKRLDASIVRFGSDILISAKMLWQSYPVVTVVVSIIFLFILGLWAHRRYLVAFLCLPKKNIRWFVKIPLIIFLFALLLFCIMGKWSTVPLRWNDAFFNGDSKFAALSLNPVVWVYDTARFDTSWTSKDSLKSHSKTLELLLGDSLFNNDGALGRW